jgi:hypothetical protein
MATSFKTLEDKDSVVTRTLLHETIPVTGTIVSGTYTGNIKNYSHGMFQSVYDYPYLSSSANHIFDLTCGYSAQSGLSASTSNMNAKKINIYNELAQVLVGYDETGAIREFDEDGNFSGGTKIREAYFFNFARLLSKDEIKKGSFSLTLGVNQAFGDTSDTKTIAISDVSGTNEYKVNSPAGEYGILYATGSDAVVNFKGYAKVGLLYYQAGIAVLSASVFNDDSPGGILNQSAILATGLSGSSTTILTGSSISGTCDALRHRLVNTSFNNTVELNSTVYFCRANNTDFNYSSNPTYLSSSKMVVKNNPQDLPVSYVTSVGLYSPDNELLAVAKLSEPLKKDPATEFTLRVRLDY